ncbi:hypothetical protein EV421DRAFT_1806907 [Armillaria borealis]|uniref:Uncharacterized protein n=1 Tax=Armillaria borealis TaxID=47425 RepID=A0AA39JKB7_9AGAR|nr:hypothetical protein EV421DRAFT_1806907 [Armillaria borealis]
MEVHDATKAMRSNIVVPVDSMGYDSAQSKEKEPRNQHFATSCVTHAFFTNERRGYRHCSKATVCCTRRQYSIIDAEDSRSYQRPNGTF